MDASLGASVDSKTYPIFDFQRPHGALPPAKDLDVELSR